MRKQRMVVAQYEMSVCDSEVNQGAQLSSIMSQPDGSHK